MNGNLKVIFLIFQDERLARFVTGSHIKHHPSATPGDAQDEPLVGRSK